MSKSIYQILLQEHSTKSMSFLETIEVAKLVGFFNQACGIDSERLQTRDLQLVNILV